MTSSIDLSSGALSNRSAPFSHWATSWVIAGAVSGIALAVSQVAIFPYLPMLAPSVAWGASLSLSLQEVLLYAGLAATCEVVIEALLRTLWPADLKERSVFTSAVRWLCIETIRRAAVLHLLRSAMIAWPVFPVVPALAVGVVAGQLVLVALSIRREIVVHRAATLARELHGKF